MGACRSCRSARAGVQRGNAQRRRDGGQTSAGTSRSIRRDSRRVRCPTANRTGMMFAASLVGDARDRVLVDGRGGCAKAAVAAPTFGAEGGAGPHRPQRQPRCRHGPRARVSLGDGRRAAADGRLSPVSNKAVTALEWVLGGNSFVAGTADGERQQLVPGAGR